MPGKARWEMNRSKLYDGLSEIDRDQVAKKVTWITKRVSEFELDVYKAYIIGCERERLYNQALEDKAEWIVYHRIDFFLIDWIDRIARKNLGLN